MLKAYISTSHRAVAQRLRSYFGRARPSVRVWAPHSSPYANSDVPADADDQRVDLEIVVISEEDGRESLVDLTKTLCEMAQRGKITADDVSVDLVDAEVKGVCPTNRERMRERVYVKDFFADVHDGGGQRIRWMSRIY